MTKPLPYNRTDNWPRLQQSGFFQISDQVGEIVVSKSGHPFFICLALIAIFGFGPLLISPFMFPLGIIFGGLFAWAAVRTLGHGFKVRFTPEELVFYGPLGNQLGTLQREAMQQIAVKEERTKEGKVHSYFHMFIADTGWMSAFYCKDETKAAVQNNVLMAAFAQPLHLDALSEPEPVAFVTAADPGQHAMFTR